MTRGKGNKGKTETARQKATRLNLRYYVSETTCLNGHKDLRQTCNGICATCCNTKSKKPIDINEVTRKQKRKQNKTQVESFDKMCKRIYELDQRW